MRSRVDMSRLTLEPGPMLVFRPYSFKDKFQEEAGYLAMKEALCRAKGARVVLGAMTRSLEGVIEQLQKDLRSLTPRHEFLKLPDELLAVIFEDAAYESHESHATSVRCSIRISHVCKRFRVIALRTPGLWINVSDTQTPELLDTLLSRSSPSGLQVAFGCIVGCRKDHANPNFLRTLTLHTERWKEVTIGNHLLVESDANPVEELKHEAYRNLELPALEQLNLTAPDDVTSSVLEDNYHFYTSWITPRLRTLTAENFVPRFIPKALALTSCHIIFDHYIDNDLMDMRSTLFFLDQCHGLKKLSLTIDDMKNEISPFPKTVLSNVESLCLTVESNAAKAVYKIMSALRLPKLTKLSLKLVHDFRTPEELCKAMDMIFSWKEQDYSSVADVSITIEESEYAFDVPRTFNPLNIIAKKFPDVQRLYVNAADARSLPFPGKAFRRLQTLTLSHCSDLSDWSFCSFVDYLRSGPAWRELKAINLIKCHFLSLARQKVEKHSERGKLVWVD